MHPEFSLFEVVLLAGIAQGSVICGMIWWHYKDSRSKLWLSALLMVFNLICVKILLHTTGLWQTPMFRYFPLPFELVIGPLAYLYVRSLTEPAFKFRKRTWLHFIPFIISLAYSVVVYIDTQNTTDLSSKDVIAWMYSFNTVKQVEDYLSVVSAIVYWFLGLRTVIAYRKWLFAEVSDTRYPTYSWLKNLSVALGILIILLFIDILVDRFAGDAGFLHWQFFFVYLAVLIYYMGMRGYTLNEEVISKSAVNVEPFVTPAITEVDPGVVDRIVKGMQTEKLYLDPELTLAGFARKIGSPANTVSSAINQQFGKSFRAFVNDYRVALVKEKLAGADARRLSLLGIAYECGFNSEASFYRIFKQSTGLSPKAYMTKYGH
jgi:AraC-like DNA-binding protein